MQSNIFMQAEYININIKPGESIFNFQYQDGDFIFKNISIKTPIANTNFYDLSSPYGYAGYYTNTDNTLFLQKALKCQTERALSENIIAEFIRFHPLLQANLFAPSLDLFIQERRVIEVYTQKQLRWELYGSKERNKIRKALKEFFVYESNDIDKFYSLYLETMRQKNAKTFYFFSKEYFYEILKLKNSIMLEAIKDNETHSMSIFLFDDLCAYYHLTANSSKHIYSHSGATRAILETFFQIAEEKKIASCILGGGTTNNLEDSLFLFKKQFSPIIKDFYIGGKIYNPNIYQDLCKKYNNKYFLKYRY